VSINNLSSKLKDGSIIFALFLQLAALVWGVAKLDATVDSQIDIVTKIGRSVDQMATEIVQLKIDQVKLDGRIDKAELKMERRP